MSLSAAKTRVRSHERSRSITRVGAPATSTSTGSPALPIADAGGAIEAVELVSMGLAETSIGGRPAVETAVGRRDGGVSPAFSPGVARGRAPELPNRL